MRTIKELMRNTDSYCKKEDSLRVLACRMFLSDFVFLPVVDDTKVVIGVVYYKDVINAAGKAALLKIDLKVNDVMKILPCIYAHEDEAAALSAMRSNKSAFLPVVDADNHFQGVISFMTLARRIIHFKRNLGSMAGLNSNDLSLSL